MLGIGLVLLAASIGLVIWAVLSQAEEKATVRASLRQLEGYEVDNVRDQELLKPVSERALAPIMATLTGLGRRFTPVGYVDQVKRKHAALGMAGSDTVDRFLAVRVVLGRAHPRHVHPVLLRAEAAGHAPHRRVPARRRSCSCSAPTPPSTARSRSGKLSIRVTLPDVLDLLVICVEAGLGFEQALDRTVASVPGALTEEFSRMLGEVRAGATRADAMRNLEARCDVPELRSFVLAILQADTFGVSIGRVLRAQADEMRIKRRQLAAGEGPEGPGEDADPDGVLHLPGPLRGRARAGDHQHHPRTSDPMAAPTAAAPPGGRRQRRGQPSVGQPGFPMLATAVGAGLVLWGLADRPPAAPRQQLPHPPRHRPADPRPTAASPRSDPYSFTALGDPWVVQSWFASLLYGLADKLGGLDAVRVLNALMVAGLAALVWHLTRPARLVPLRRAGRHRRLDRRRRVGRAAAAVRPARDRRRARAGRGPERPPLADPDHVDLGRTPTARSRSASSPSGSSPSAPGSTVAVPDGSCGCSPGWRVGTALAALNPLGPRLLLFPLEVLRKSDQFRGIEEWQPLRLDSAWALLFVGQVLLAALLLARRRSWRVALPLVVFTGLALMSPRNVAVASIVLLPGMAICATGLGSVDGRRRSQAALAGVAVCVVAGLVLGVSALTGPDAQLRPYPEQAVTWLDDQGRLEDRLVAPDYVGNYLEARYGARGDVFIDDRVDMYPAAVVDDSLTLLRAEPGWQEALARYEPGAVLWPKDKPLTDLLEQSPDWRPVYEDADWTVFEPT